MPRTKITMQAGSYNRIGVLDTDSDTVKVAGVDEPLNLSDVKKTGAEISYYKTRVEGKVVQKEGKFKG